MTRRAAARLALAAALAAAGCGAGGAPPEAPPPPAEDAYRDALRLARAAFNEGRYGQAAVLYDRAVALAKRRDDLEAIAVSGFERGLTALRDGAPGTAVTVAERTEAELVRRGAAPRPALSVLAGWGAYLAGDLDGAARRAGRVEASAAGDGALAARIALLQGLIAADRGDAAALDRAIAGLDRAGPVADPGDRLELHAHADRLRGDMAAARAGFLEAVRERRRAGDLHGIARGLGAAADAALAEGRPAVAADLYLRAGRGGRAHGAMADSSRRWLTAARDLGRAHGLPAIALEAEEMLRTS